MWHLMSLLFGSDPGPQTVPVEYLIVAGGGRGGSASQTDGLGNSYSGGGGGAGGLLSGTRTTTRGEVLQITVGRGGGPAGFPYPIGTQLPAGDSRLGDLVAFGGGRGGDALGGNGQAGGSGGGGGGGPSGSRGTGGSGVSGQGSAGSTPSNDNGGPGGGLSVASSITGAEVTYATGGDQTGIYDLTSPTANTGNGGRGGGVGGPGVQVTGGGEVDSVFRENEPNRPATVNGFYVAAGTYEYGTTQSSMWRLASTEYWILAKGSSWEIGYRSGLDTVPAQPELFGALYTLNSLTLDESSQPIANSTLPGTSAEEPATAVNQGRTPNPDVVYVDYQFPLDATSGASGVVILAIPSDTRVVVSGLSYTVDTESRAGLTVYKFTSGSGTILFV